MIPAGRHGARIAGARERLLEQGVAGLFVGPGADLRWLTGYDAPALERLTLLVLPADGPASLVVPQLEEAGGASCAAVETGEVGLQVWHEVEDPYALVAGIVRRVAGRASGSGGAAPRRWLVGDRLWAQFVLRLQAALGVERFGLASEALRDLRSVKDADEIRLLRAAAQAADRTVLGIAAGRLVGRSEADVAREVRERLVDEGHDRAEFWIVGSGPNSAEPHHTPGGRIIEAGEPIVLDIGGSLAGYGSDTTRTLWATGGDGDLGPDVVFRRLYATLESAQAAATAAVRPGATGEAIDAAAREPIAAAGFGPNFVHRTGHGIGLEAHEDPYLVAGNAEPLRAGNTFSIEPGIYLAGRYGARIEDIVACALSGPDVLNSAPRELLVVAGT